MTDADDIAGLVERIWCLDLRRVVLAAAVDLASKRLSFGEDYARVLQRMANDLDYLLKTGGRDERRLTEAMPLQTIALGATSRPAVQDCQVEVASATVERAVTRERMRLARKVHDGLTQELTSLVLELEAAQRLAARDPQSVPERLSEATRTARDCLSEVRRLLAELHSKPSGPTGLVSGLQRLVDEFRHEHGLSVSLKCAGPDPAVSRDVEQGIVGTIREALTNAKKHSRAAVVVVILHTTVDVLEGMVFDDGQGFDYQVAEEAARKGASFGLVSMRQSITALGGTFDIDSRRGKGTRVYLRVPLTAQVASM